MKRKCLFISLVCFFILTGFENGKEIEHSYNTKDGIHPLIQEKTSVLIKKAKKIGISITVVEGFRSAKRQNELYNSGRGVTTVQAGHSYHNHGLAFDVFVKSDVKGSRAWGFVDTNENDRDDWVEVGEIGETLGLTWGGRWDDFVDKPHFEFTFGLTQQELINGTTPENLISKIGIIESRQERIGRGTASFPKILSAKEKIGLFAIEVLSRWVVLFCALYVLYSKTIGERLEGHRYRLAKEKWLHELGKVGFKG